MQVLTGAQDSNSGYLENIIQVAAGAYHNLALAKDGTVWSWGYNYHGQLGNRTTANSSLPVKVIGVSDVVSIAAGYYNSFAVRKDGSVWSWGRNEYGSLGNGNTSNQLIPRRVLGGASGSQYLTDIVEVKAATMHTLALKANGTVYAWGYNYCGQLGSNGGNSYTPVQAVTGTQKSASGYLEKVVDIDVSSGNNSGWGTSIALTESKEVYGWGYSGYGQLGKIETFKSPIKVSNINTAVGAALGGTDNTYFTYILKEDGTIASLGYNNYGQLGNGTTSSSAIAQDVQNSENLINGILQVTGSQNGYFGAFVKKDGTVWTVGLNSNGQLGNGSQDNKSRPIQVGGGSSNAMHISYGKIMHGTTVIEEFDNPNNIISNITIAEDDTFVIDKSKITAKQSFSLLPDTDTLSTNDVNITS